MPEPLHRAASSPRRRREKPPAARAIKILEGAGGALLCLLAAITPWLFGTTEEWSVRLMNIGGYIAGGIFAAVAVLLRFTDRENRDEARTARRMPAVIFLILNLAVLAFCVVALWNARADFSVEDRSFAYRDNYNPSLPTTYDAELTAQTLASFSGCFVVFWSLRSWLLRGSRRRTSPEESGMLANLRFQVFLWIFTLNGMAVAVQGILQRLSGSAKLLWLRESWWNTPLSCFGPFSYRGNAAEYLNLVWPVAIGFWWVLSRDRRRRIGSARLFTDGPELLLLPATVMMVAGSFVSLSRGGAIIAGALVGAIGLMFMLQKNLSTRVRIGFAAFMLTVGLAVFLLGGKILQARFQQEGLHDLSGREEIYRNAKQMAADFPIFGSGPGTFRSVYHLYRQDTGEMWHGFLHDDWLETLVTFGWVGLALAGAHLVVLAFWIWSAGRPAILWVFPVCGSLGLLGTLAHARFDFPFQTYSVLFTFVVICAILTSVSAARRGVSG